MQPIAPNPASRQTRTRREGDPKSDTVRAGSFKVYELGIVKHFQLTLSNQWRQSYLTDHPTVREPD